MKKLRNFLFLLGLPFSPFYSAVMVFRSFLYRKGFFKSHRLPVPVVSVGNLTMGGTGKTPLVMYLANSFKGMDRKPAIVSRGYGGSANGPVNVVSDGRKVLLGPDAAGDEPRLLAESLPGVPVLTGPKRAAVGRFAVERFQPDILILDDGFQHMSVCRDLDIVLINGRSLLGDGIRAKLANSLTIFQSWALAWLIRPYSPFRV